MSNQNKQIELANPIAPLTPEGQEGSENVYQSYLEELDPRGNSSTALDLHRALNNAKDKRFNAFLNCLSNGKMRRWKLVTIARHCNISMAEFAEFWQSSQRARIIARAQDGLVKVTEDIVNDSLSKQVPCERCDGFGYLQVLGVNLHGGAQTGLVTLENGDVIRSCPSCSGTGFIAQTGDIASRKMLLDITGMSQKSQPVVQINQSFGDAGLKGATDRLNQISFDDVIDVTPEETD